MLYGLTSKGFRLKRMDEILFELQESFRSSLGQSLDVNPETSVIGQIATILAEREALVWEAAKGAYDSMYPASADDVSLDNVASMTGVERRPATKSTTDVTCSGTPGTVLSVGRVLSVAGTGARFVLAATATIGLGGSISASFEAQETGSVQAPAGTLTIIETPVTGWSSASNPADADVGDDVESDVEFRVRRRESLRVIGAATVDAIRSRLLDDVAGVVDAIVRENDGDVVDLDGVPPHSLHCIVGGGAAQDIGELIWRTKAAGIRSYGVDESVIVADTQGFTHAVDFDRAKIIRTFLHVQIAVGTSFNQGAKQKERVTVTNNSVGDTLTVTINGRALAAVADATAALTAAAIAIALTTVGIDWIPTTVLYTPGNDYLDIESTYKGNAFSLTVASGGSTDLTIVSQVLSAGSQEDVREDIMDFADGAGEVPKEQRVGRPLYRSRYVTPVNWTSDINSVSMWIASGEEDLDYWPTTAPTGGLDWVAADLIVAADEVVDLDQLRVTVELV